MDSPAHPTALFALLGIGAIYVLGRRAVDRGTGLAAAAILAATPGYFAMGRLLTTDMLLTGAMTVALAAFFLASESRSPRLYLLFWAASAVATLAKGPVALALAGLVAGAYVLVTRRWGTLREMRWLAGALVVAAVVLPWFVLVQLRHHEFLEFFVVRQHLERLQEERKESGERLERAHEQA